MPQPTTISACVRVKRLTVSLAANLVEAMCKELVNYRPGGSIAEVAQLMIESRQRRRPASI